MIKSYSIHSKALGYSLTGSTREQIMFILFGKGRNGKSIFVEVVSEILGDYSNNMQAKSLMVKKTTMLIPTLHG